MKTEQEIEEKLKRTEQENKRLLETINAKPLETVDMDRAFEIEKLKDQLQAKEQECEELKDKNQYLINTCCHFKNEIKKYKKAVHKYKVVLQDKIKRLHLSRREFLKEINSVPVKIACKGENFKNALNNFNKDIQVINNEDNYKQALDEIEGLSQSTLDEFENDDKEQQLLYCKQISEQILNIINKTKENN